MIIMRFAKLAVYHTRNPWGRNSYKRYSDAGIATQSILGKN